MADTSNTPITRATPVMDFVLGGKEFSLFPTAVQKFVLHETVSGAANMAYFRLYDKNAQTIETILRLAKDSFKFRFGWQDGQNSPWKTLKVFIYDVELRTHGLFLDLWLGDETLLDTVVNTSQYTDQKISDIVKAVCAKNKWDCNVEDTDGKCTFRQNNISDTRFLKEWLMPRALSAKTGRGDYRMYFENGTTLHFHPPKYEEPDYKTYDAMQDTEHPIDIFRYRSDIIRTEMSGGVKMRVEGYDPINKRIIPVDVTDDTTPEKYTLGLKIPDYATGDGLGAYMAVPFKDDTMVLNYAKQHWYSRNIQMHPAYIRMRCDPYIASGRNLKILMEPLGSGVLVQGSGRYLIETVVTYMSARGFYQHLLMVRNAFKEQEKGVTSVETKPGKILNLNIEDNVITVFGRKINLKEVMPVK